MKANIKHFMELTEEERNNLTFDDWEIYTSQALRDAVTLIHVKSKPVIQAAMQAKARRSIIEAKYGSQLYDIQE